MAVPPGGAKAVIMCLHGRNGSDSFAFESIGVHDFVAAQQLPWAVVGIDGGVNSYWHSRADGTDSQAMVFEELLPVVRAKLTSVALLLLGWSMGGYGALLAAADRRKEVSAVAAASPALWRSVHQAAPGAFDGADDFDRHDVFRRVAALSEVPVWIGCGDADPFASASIALAAQLPLAATAFVPGSHDLELWRRFLPSQLAFFRRTVGHAGISTLGG